MAYVGAVLVMVLPRLGLAQAPSWQIECVDAPRQFSDLTNRCLALDAQGHPHIAFGEDGLHYTWYDGATWQF